MTPKQKQFNQYLLRKYGITYARREQILESQQGACAICKKLESDFKNRLAVDHNHKSGHVRGLLCFYCNKYRVGRHTWGTIVPVYEYLKFHESNMPTTRRPKRKPRAV